MDRHELERGLTERLAALGFEPVDIRFGGSTRRPHLSIRIDWIEALPGRAVAVDDCAAASRAIESWLDEAHYAGGRYILEVSSPGVDRPLRKLADWKRFAGRPVDVLVPSLGGRFRVTARGVDDATESVELEFPKGVRRTIRLTEIKEARLGFDG